jgi:hypothetical protein
VRSDIRIDHDMSITHQTPLRSVISTGSSQVDRSSTRARQNRRVRRVPYRRLAAVAMRSPGMAAR